MTTEAERLLESLEEEEDETKTLLRTLGRCLRHGQFRATGDARDLVLVFGDGEMKLRPDGTWNFSPIKHEEKEV